MYAGAARPESAPAFWSARLISTTDPKPILLFYKLLVTFNLSLLQFGLLKIPFKIIDYSNNRRLVTTIAVYS